jgi:beta-glucosidase
VQVRLRVENIGSRDGKEVVQLYVHEEKPTVDRPVRELKAFEKVAIKAGQSTEVVFVLTEDAFSYYSEELNAWTDNEGAFQIQIGKNAQEIVLSAAVMR